MKKQVIGFLILCFFLFTHQSCFKLEDTVFKMVVLDGTDSTGIQNMGVNITKYKQGSVFSGPVVVETYSGKTNAKGELSFFIDNYNRDFYFYDIIVNNFTGMPEDYGGYGYGKYGTVLNPDEMDKLLVVKLGRILFPDSVFVSKHTLFQQNNNP